MLVNLFGSYGSNEHTCLEMTVKREPLKTSIADPAACKGIVALDKLKENYGHTIPGNPGDLMDWCLEQPTSALLDLLAYAAAKSVNAVKSGYLERKLQRAHADRLAQALKIDVTQWYEPTGENYFSRISKTGIKQAITEQRRGRRTRRYRHVEGRRGGPCLAQDCRNRMASRVGADCPLRRAGARTAGRSQCRR
ncbi:hypothetical protein AB3G45_03875 [Shinella sp. S4-D37]|uniref:hypothetical protein n=1 Tax=Shinella sp. S4-D37 TaxID=3161999 RepID=UPI0034679A5D